MRPRRQISKVLAALTSSVVVLAAAFYVVAPTKEVMSLAVTEKPLVAGHVADRPEAAHAVGTHHVAPTVVVYGSARGPKGAVPEAGSVSLRAVLHGAGSLAKVDMGPGGTFRTVAKAPGLYKAIVQAEFGHRWYQAVKVIALVPGRAYDISAVLRSESVFTMLPVTSY